MSYRFSINILDVNFFVEESPKGIKIYHEIWGLDAEGKTIQETQKKLLEKCAGLYQVIYKKQPNSKLTSEQYNRKQWMKKIKPHMIGE